MVEQMGTCGTCEHWKRNHVGFRSAVSFAQPDGDWDEGYERVEAREEADDPKFGECRRIEMGYGLSLDEPTPIAVVNDASNYQATLYTQAEFGCVLHTPAAQPEQTEPTAGGGSA